MRQAIAECIADLSLSLGIRFEVLKLPPCAKKLQILIIFDRIFSNFAIVHQMTRFSAEINLQTLLNVLLIYFFDSTCVLNTKNWCHVLNKRNFPSFLTEFCQKLQFCTKQAGFQQNTICRHCLMHSRSFPVIGNLISVKNGFSKKNDIFESKTCVWSVNPCLVPLDIFLQSWPN